MPLKPAAGIVVVVLVVAGGAYLVQAAKTSGAECVDPAAMATNGTVVSGYSGDQLANAAVIMDTATSLGLDQHAQLVGVMAAMGESSLRNLDYGDYQTSGVLNPDGTPTTSLGLFQQQDWWGTPEERLDPATSATLFFHKLVDVPGWEFLPASQVIHEVQANTDPDHYAKWEDDARAVTAALRATCG